MGQAFVTARRANWFTRAVPELEYGTRTMASAVSTAPDGLLRGAGFDLFFIAGLALLGLGAGLVATIEPRLFWPIVVLDLWLLGYHHVIATYTRLAFDRESLREHRWMVLYLPLGVAAAVLAIVLSFGAWLLVSIYVYWQWFHYVRQSEGISKAYAGRSRDRDIGDARLTRFAFWAVPLAGILDLSARAPSQFLTMPMRALPVPTGVATAATVVAGIAFALWLLQQLQVWRRGRLAAPYFGYMLSHFTIFATAYIALRDFNVGWLAVNIWHNAQYVLFVWLYNNRRFNGGIDSQRVFLSTISQSGRFWMYGGVCLALSTTIYFLLERYGVAAVGSAMGVSAAVAAVAIYQTVNFHHYVVDALIWKLRKPAMRSKLGLN